ncbi:MAG TPA: carboxylesterase family protein, partial [Jatrophihabitans sp.]|nr:carboxylesterase family protein [Jatrophihabitans sp.]
SNDWPLYDGSALARRGIVVVTVNARLGFEGFTPLDGAPDNRAALDWLAALRWVRDNIAAFGGDPDAVTLAGQSAGGGATAALLTASAARGLFRRAIVLSATTPSLDRELAYRRGARLLHSLGVAPTRAGLASVPEDALVAAAAAAYGPGWRVADPVQRVRNMLVGPPFRLVADAQLGIGEVLDASRAGAGAGVRVLAGHTAAEFTGQFAALGDRVDEAVLDAALAELGGPGPAVRRAYRERYGGLSPAATLGQAYTDAVFRLSNHRLASARRAGGGTTYVYEFSGADAGSAAHGADVPHVFGTAGGPAPEDTGRDLQDAVVLFVTSGEPGWEPYDRGGLVHRFGPDGREPAALAWERDVWPADRIPGR